MEDADEIHAEYCTETYDFGPCIGELSLQQLSGKNFHQQCLSVNSQDSDNTGTRMHQGAHVLIRLLAKYAHVLHTQDSWIELGAGCGIVTLAALSAMCHQSSNKLHIVITDGNEKCLPLIEANLCTLNPLSTSSLPLSSISPVGGDINIARLHWGNEDDITHSLAFNNHKPFDVIVGSELIYYRVDPNHLVQTVNKLAGPNTIFIHAHIIRVAGMGTELVNLLEDKGYDTYEYNVKDIANCDELANNPGFYDVRTLITVPREQGDEILKIMMGINSKTEGDTTTADNNWVIRKFVESYDSDGGGGNGGAEYIDNDNIFSVLMQNG